MVAKDGSLYLLIGQDTSSKDAKIKNIKDSLISKKMEHFNLDVLYGRELTLKLFQERFILFPVQAAKRIILIRQAESLKEDVKKFILNNLKAVLSKLVLILDAGRFEKKDEFLKRLLNFALVYRFADPLQADAFVLSRQVEFKKTDFALKTLNKLLESGERPERILGGLRFAWEKQAGGISGIKKRLKLLLDCDIDIKTGKLKPEFALEKLIVSLCALGNARAKA